MNIDERLDLDNHFTKAISKYPFNEDDYILYFRGKESLNEHFIASKGESRHFGLSLFMLATKSETFADELKTAYELLIGFENEKK